MMQNEALITETGRLLAALPEDKARSVRDFAAFLAQQLWAALPIVEDPLPATETETEFRADVAAVMQHTTAFDFLHDEPDLYTDKDVTAVTHAVTPPKAGARPGRAADWPRVSRPDGRTSRRAGAVPASGVCPALR